MANFFAQSNPLGLLIGQLVQLNIADAVAAVELQQVIHAYAKKKNDDKLQKDQVEWLIVRLAQLHHKAREDAETYGAIFKDDADLQKIRAALADKQSALDTSRDELKAIEEKKHKLIDIPGNLILILTPFFIVGTIVGSIFLMAPLLVAGWMIALFIAGQVLGACLGLLGTIYGLDKTEKFLTQTFFQEDMDNKAIEIANLEKEINDLTSKVQFLERNPLLDKDNVEATYEAVIASLEQQIQECAFDLTLIASTQAPSEPVLAPVAVLGLFGGVDSSKLAADAEDDVLSVDATISV